jgi:RNA polymerase-binding protein DksA
MRSPKKRKNSEMDNLHHLLITKRDELATRIEQRRQELIGEQEPEDEVGLALRSSSAGMAIANIEREVRMLSEIELALRLMDKGEYGICSSCGEEIPALRLRAIPWTRRCVECAGGGVSGSRDSRTGRASGIQSGLLSPI